MKIHTRKFLSVLLTAALLFTVAIPAVSAAAVSGKELELIPIDPASLNVSKLGDAEAEDAKEAETAPYGLNDTVRVSIFLDEPSAKDAGYALQGIGTNAAAVSYRNALKASQSSVQSKIEAAIGSKIDVKWNLTLLTNAISAFVKYGDIEKIAALDGVKSVEIEAQYAPAETVDGETASPNMTNARDMVGANSGNATKYNGAGTRVAIIDTGLDYEHQSFNAEAFEYAIAEDEANNGRTYDLLTAEELNELKDSLNSKTANYVSSKIPYGYNYVDRGTRINHVGDTQEEHGSHVAGITASNRYLKSGDEFVSAAETVGVLGEAPDAQVFVMKVFGSGGGAYDSDYFSAVEDAVVLGASSANLSLGSSLPGVSTASATYQAILTRLESTDLVMSVSMGNNTSWDSQKQLYADDVNLHTGGSPGSFNNSLTVASIDDTGSSAPFLHFADGVEFKYTEGGGAANNAPMTTVAGEYEYVYVDAVGTAAHFAAVDVEGKIAICNRGETSFFEKANAAVEAGAVAVVIVNNQAGTISMSLDGYSYTNPVVSIKQSEGAAIKAVSESGEAEGLTYYTGTVTIDGEENKTPLKYYEMSSFSSWGVPGSLTLKPEITAPGGSVLSLNGYHQAATGGYAGGHDAYELMSGTSMAAPQITGLVGAIGQYYNDNDIKAKTGLSARHFAQSLLMSTAVPVMEEESAYYYSLLKQGAGLANLEGVVDAKSFIKMGADATMSADDYKVKAELGDDPSRSGNYSFSFSITNFDGAAVPYTVSTELFTQALSANKALMEHTTVAIDAEASYSWEIELHNDVNGDGKVDDDDVQAILDQIVGIYEGEFNASVADVDGDGAVTSNDAYQLAVALRSELSGEGAVIDNLSCGATATVTVSLSLSDEVKAEFDAERVGGAYIEGFTFVKAEGDVEHSIPILGFYGSWTDASMFDAVRYEEAFYGSSQSSYFNASNPNVWYIQYNGSSSSTAFVGNPYVKEESFPADRLALNNDANLYQVHYNLIRASAGGALVVLDDENHILYSANPASNANAAYFNTQSSNPSWQNTSGSNATLGRTVSSLGVNEGEKFTFGYFAFPEYYAYQANNSNLVGSLTSAQFQKIITDGNYGKGAYVGYTVTVDNTAPVVSTPVINSDGTVSIQIHDNQYVANVRVMDVSGKKTYVSVVPAQDAPDSDVTFTFDPAEFSVGNAVTIFVADYAGNEVAALVRLADGPIIIEKTIYTLTDTLEAGKNYLIVNENTTGARFALSHTNNTKGRADAAVVNRNGVLTVENVDPNAVFTAAENGSGVTLKNGNYYLAVTRNNVSFSTSTPASTAYFTFDGTNNRLAYRSGNSTYYVRYNNNAFTGSSTAYSVYLYTEETYTEEFDPDAVSTVTVTPDSLALYTGDKAALTVEVGPVTALDKTVTWASSDETVATVDQNGKVEAVGAGDALITVTSNSNSDVSASCAVTVKAVTHIDASVSAQIVDATGPKFVKIDLNDLSTELLGEAAGIHYGGGRSNDIIIGFQTDGNIIETDIYEDGYDSYILGSFGTTSYNSKDGAHIPTVSAVVDDVLISEEYLSIFLAQSYLLLLTPDYGITGWNFSGYSALTYAGTDPATGSHYYYALNGNGQLVPLILGVDEETPVDAESGELSLVLSTGTATAINGLSTASGTFGSNYMSMSLLDTGALYGLLIANSNTKEIYFVDLTGETLEAVLVAGFTGATSLTTLYNDDYDTSVVSIARAKDIERIKADIISSGNEVLKAEDFGSISKEPVNAVAGGLNAAKKEDAADTDYAVVVSDEADVTNGLLVLDYNPEELAFVSEASNADFTAVNVDEENGQIKFAYVSLKAIPAGEAILCVDFENAGCEDSEVTVTTVERNDALALEESEDFNVEGIGHAYGDPAYVWTETENGYTVTASAVCENDESHVISETVTASYEVVKAAKAEEDGLGVYTAAFEDAHFETQTKEVVIPALGHDYEFVGFVWNEDGSVTAVYVDHNDGDKKYEVKVDVTSVKTEATVTEDGEIVYTVTYVLDGKTYTETKVEKIEAIGFILGDVDDDKQVTPADARFALRAAVGLENYNKNKDSREFFAANVDHDETITPADARSILRAAVGLEELK